MTQVKTDTTQQQEIAEVLLDIGAVGFKPHQPLTFKSGIISPVYVDNRIFPFYPAAWKQVLTGFQNIIQKQKLEFEVIAGIETAGIPHSAALGYVLETPSVFIRKKIKDHGTKSRIEGGDVQSQQVLLIEDHVTTGSSSLAGVEALRQDQATVTDCLAITSYGFESATKAFDSHQVRLHTLTTFPVILTRALERKLFSNQEKKSIEDWFHSPSDWGQRHGFV